MALVCIALIEMVCLPVRQSRVADVSPRVLAVLPSSSPTGETTAFTEHSLTVLSEQELDWLQSGVVFPPAPAPKKTLIGVLATSQAPRASSRAEVRGPSFRNAPPPNNSLPVQIVRGVGSVAARSIQATGPDCAQWTRDAVAYGGSKGSKPYCASQRRGTLWLLG